jgi:hypothetical protein
LIAQLDRMRRSTSQAQARQIWVTAGQRGSGSHRYQVADREVVEGDLRGPGG